MAFERISSEEVFAGNLIRVRREQYRHEDGEVVEREVAAHPGAAVIVAHDGENVYLVEQPREVVGMESLLELPAGKIDPGETPEQTAARELVEETGRSAGTLERLATVYASPGFSDETFHLFLATELAEEEAGGDEEERITVKKVPLSDLDGVLAEVRDAKTLIGLLMLARRLSA